MIGRHPGLVWLDYITIVGGELTNSFEPCAVKSLVTYGVKDNGS